MFVFCVEKHHAISVTCLILFLVACFMQLQRKIFSSFYGPQLFIEFVFYVSAWFVYCNLLSCRLYISVPSWVFLVWNLALFVYKYPRGVLPRVLCTMALTRHDATSITMRAARETSFDNIDSCFMMYTSLKNIYSCDGLSEAVLL